MSPPNIRLLVVDDTALYRKVLTEAAAQVPGLDVVAALPSGPLALARLATEQIDLVLLDVFMPEMNGPEVLERIRRDHPRVAVVMISAATSADAAITVSALANGALDFIPKPQTASFSEGMVRLRTHLLQISRLVQARRLNQGAAAAVPAATTTRVIPATAPAAALFAAATAAPAAAGTRRRRGTVPTNPELLLVGVSTGGPRALQEVLPRLPADFRLPVLVVQHMPPIFTRTLAEQLDKVCALRVSEAGDGEPVQAGRILIAPGGRHLEIVRRDDGGFVTRLTDAPPVNSCRPAVDVLFRSAARCQLRGALTLILTGMGEDGANGVADLKAAAPVWSIAQDEATCVVYGMPAAIVRRELDDEVLPLPAIAPRLAELGRARP